MSQVEAKSSSESTPESKSSEPEFECGDEVVFRASFDPKLKEYSRWICTWVLSVLFFIVVLVCLIFLNRSILILGIGSCLVAFWWMLNSFELKRIASMKVTLTKSFLIIREGVWSEKEIMIPIDRIQDITVKQGPLDRRFGLFSIGIQTAGSSSPTAIPEGYVFGLQDAKGFRNKVIEQRVIFFGKSKAPSAPISSPSIGSAPSSSSDGETLKEMRDILVRMEELMKEMKLQGGWVKL